MKFVSKFDCCGNYSIFGKNSWVLKVLAHDKSYEIQKKFEILIFHGMMKKSINKTSLGWKWCQNLSVVVIIQFFVEIFEF